MSTAFDCGHWAGRSVDACEADYGRDVHGRRPDGTWVNTHGCAFRQLPDDVPWLRPFYSDLELRFNSIPYVCWSSHNWHLAVGICAAYVVLVFGGQALMSVSRSEPGRERERVEKSRLRARARVEACLCCGGGEWGGAGARSRPLLALRLTHRSSPLACSPPQC